MDHLAFEKTQNLNIQGIESEIDIEKVKLDKKIKYLKNRKVK